MALEEIYADRNRSYSLWHRPSSLKRFLPESVVNVLSKIDLDSIEYDHKYNFPLIFIETAVDIGQDRKNHKVLRNTARKAGLPAWVVLCKLSKDCFLAEYPCAHCGHPARHPDIVSFRFLKIYPKKEPHWTECTPAEYARHLVEWRDETLAELRVSHPKLYGPSVRS